MAPTAILGPVFGMFGLTFLVWTYMYIRRISWITRNEISPVELAIPGKLAELAPAEVSNPSDNLKNLFELPVLFYAVCLYLFASAQVDVLHVISGWVFLGFRVVHSVVHCSVNVVMVRFNLYLISALALWLMLGRAAMGWLAAP